MVTLSQAKKLIKLARDSIGSYFTGKDLEVAMELQKEFSNKQGAFVTIYIEDELAGCIGYSEPVLPLWQAVALAAKSAAFEDSRFPPITHEKLKKATIELSILTVPQKIEGKPETYASKIRVGKDGLIVKDKFFGAGLLLPQVATEWNWDSKRFLAETCRKAGLDLDCWKNRSVFKFQAQIFTEEKGQVIEKKIA